MRLQRIDSVRTSKPEDAGDHGVVEVQYKDGHVEQMDISEIDLLTIHARRSRAATLCDQLDAWLQGP